MDIIVQKYAQDHFFFYLDVSFLDTHPASKEFKVARVRTSSEGRNQGRQYEKHNIILSKTEGGLRP